MLFGCHTVTVAVTDDSSARGTGALEVTVDNLAPTGIGLSNDTLEDAPRGAIVGALSSTDYETEGHVYTLVAGEGSDDNASLLVDGDQLKTAAVLPWGNLLGASSQHRLRRGVVRTAFHHHHQFTVDRSGITGSKRGRGTDVLRRPGKRDFDRRGGFYNAEPEAKRSPLTAAADAGSSTATAICRCRPAPVPKTCKRWPMPFSALGNTIATRLDATNLSAGVRRGACRAGGARAATHECGG